MRKTRRLAAIAAAAMMTAALALPMSMSSFAADAEYSITVGNNGSVVAANHTLGAYQIFDFELDAEGKISGAVNWGSSATPAVQTALRTATGVATDATAETVMNAMKDLKDDSAEVDAIAKAIGGALTESDDPVATSDENGKINVTTVGAGYYFVKDIGTIGAGDAATKFMLQVLGKETVNIKTDAPTLVKKIWHNDPTADSNNAVTTPPTPGKTAPEYAEGVTATGWNDVGDNKIGDKVYYMTASTVPNMSDYQAYEYKIHDQMCDGLTFGEVTKVVYIPAGAAEGYELEKDKHYSVSTNVTNGDATDDFVVDFENLKWILATVDAGKVCEGGTIYTYYTATLNENAKISASANLTQFNENKAQLEYSNNPNASGRGFKDENKDGKPDTPDSPDTPEDKGDEEKDENNKDSEKGNTEWDFVYDWTFVTNGNKVEVVNGANQPLSGATFELKDASSNAVSLVKVTDTTNIQSAEAGRDYYRLAKSGETTGVVTEIVTNADGKFAFVGLDDSVTYTLHEKKAPDGYSVAGDADLVLTAAYDKAEALKTLTLAVTTDDKQNVTSADNTVTIVDKKKTFELPSTGGIGTTLFYVVGGALVAGAGVTLITKKRINDSEK